VTGNYTLFIADSARSVQKPKRRRKSAKVAERRRKTQKDVERCNIY